MLTRISVVFFLTVCLPTLLNSPIYAQTQNQFENETSFQLYYGGDNKLVDSMMKEIKPAQLVVVDLRGLTDDQLSELKKRTQNSNAKLIAYLSIGELHSRELELFKTFSTIQDPNIDFDKLKSEVLISENTVFSSFHADVSQPMWRAFILDKANQILASGVDGLFLDTVDTADIYIQKQEWKVDRRAESVTAMVALIREMKKQDPSRYIMQNRGLNLIGKEIFVGDDTGKMIPGMLLAQTHNNNPDAILFENAFSSDSDWAKGKLKMLDAIHKSGEVTVVALGYKDTLKDRDTFLKKCTPHGFVPAWATNSLGLHLEIAK